MTEFETAEAIVKKFEDKRQHLIQKRTELSDEKQKISFAAHSGDAKARQRLDKINSETAVFTSEFESIEAAITEANARLNVAKAAESLAVDREAAKQIAALKTAFIENGINA